MATVVKEAAAPAGEYRLVPIGSITVADGFNNRRSLGDITELAESIKSVGLLEPLLVWRVAPHATNNGALTVIAGHRRLAAAKKAGLVDIPVIVVDLDERGRMEALLVENLHRLDIDPLEEAEGYKRLLTFGLKQQEIAAKVGRSPAHISKRLSLLELPKEVHDLVVAGKLHIADALEFVPFLKEPEVVAETVKHLKESIKNGWGFRVEDHARGAKHRLEKERKRQVVLDRLKAEKVSIITKNTWDLTKLGQGSRRLPMTAAAHSKFPCHAAFVDEYDLDVHYVCTKPANHKTSEDKDVAKAAKAITSNRSYGGPAADKAQAKKAAESRERNKVLRDRQPIRTAELVRLLTARQGKEIVVDFVLRQLLQRFLDESPSVAALAAQILELPTPKGKRNSWEQPKVDWASYLSGGNDRLLRLAYALALASGEHPYRTLVDKGFFDEELSPNAARYIEHLKANGYKPDKFELAQLTPANKYRWRAPFDKAKGKEA